MLLDIILLCLIFIIIVICIVYSGSKLNEYIQYLHNQTDVSIIDNKQRILNVHRPLMNIKKPYHVDSLSFSGGSYHGAYHIGVVRFIFEHSEMFRYTRYLGSSIGACIAAIVLAYEKDKKRMDVIKSILKYLDKISISVYGSISVVDYAIECTKNIINENRFNQYIRNSERYTISATNITNGLPKNELFTNFSNYDSFLNTLTASMSLPILLDNKIRKIGNRVYIDGVFSNNHPTYDESTIKVSAYPVPYADIAPTNLYDTTYSYVQPPKKYVIDMMERGYNDISKFLENKVLLFKQYNPQVFNKIFI